MQQGSLVSVTINADSETHPLPSANMLTSIPYSSKRELNQLKFHFTIVKSVVRIDIGAYTTLSLTCPTSNHHPS